MWGRGLVLATVVFFAAIGSGSAAAPSWQITTTSNPPFSEGGNELTAVSCGTPLACEALGDGNSMGGLGLLGQSWNGMRWTDVSSNTPDFNTSGISATGVSCPSVQRCYGVGVNSYPPGPYYGFVLSWNGTGWKDLNAPVPRKINTSFNGISCTTVNFCLAVGGAGKGLLADRWNGRRLRPVAVPRGDKLEFDAVSCTASNACVAVGRSAVGVHVGLAESWNGRSWQVQPTPRLPGARGSTLVGVSCTTARACVAVGYRNSSRHKVAIAERWNGHHWILMTTPTISPGGSLNAVSCAGAKACMAVGSSKGALAEWWNGRTWVVQTLPTGSGAFLASVSCVSPTAIFCTAVGSANGNTRALTYSSRP
jgi:hypothetical protein